MFFIILPFYGEFSFHFFTFGSFYIIKIYSGSYIVSCFIFCFPYESIIGIIPHSGPFLKRKVTATSPVLRFAAWPRGRA